MTRFSMLNIAHTMATEDFNERCELLDSRLTEALKTAIGEERISSTREQRIVNRFCDILLKK